MGDVVNNPSNADQEIFLFEASDEALEAAASSMKDKAGAMTLAFCSGLDACPPRTQPFHGRLDLHTHEHLQKPALY